MFAKSRDGVLHSRYSRLHTTWQTPYIAIFFIWFVGVVLLFSSSYLSSVNEILETSISAMGYQICFYLSITGLACAWHFRDSIRTQFSKSITKVIWPLLSSLFLIFVLFYSILDADRLTNIVGIGGIVLGIIPFLLQKTSLYKK